MAESLVSNVHLWQDDGVFGYSYVTNPFVWPVLATCRTAQVPGNLPLNCTQDADMLNPSRSLGPQIQSIGMQ